MEKEVSVKVVEGDKSLIESLRSEYEDAYELIDEDGESFTDELSWRSLRSDMAAFSKKHPSALFLVYERSPEHGHEYYSYFKDGAVQAVQMAKTELKIEPFDPKKAKPV